MSGIVASIRVLCFKKFVCIKNKKREIFNSRVIIKSYAFCVVHGSKRTYYFITVFVGVGLMPPHIVIVIFRVLSSEITGSHGTGSNPGEFTQTKITYFVTTCSDQTPNRKCLRMSRYSYTYIVYTCKSG